MFAVTWIPNHSPSDINPANGQLAHRGGWIVFPLVLTGKEIYIGQADLFLFSTRT